MKKIFLPVLFSFLFGTNFSQPVASVSPTSITATVLCGDSTSVPLTISNTGSTNLTYDILSSGFGLAGDSSVLVIQETDAWTVYMNTFFQTNFGITPTVITSSQIASTNFMLYDIVITVGDESTTYYTNISNNVAKFEAFANAGGIVQYQMATQGGTNVNLVGGAVMMYGNNETQNTGLIMSHPILNGLTNPLNGNSANHSYITNVPVGAQILTQTTSSLVPTTIEYTYGNGRVIATGMTWEWLSANTGYNASPMLLNACTYILSLINPVPSWLSFSQTSGTVIPSGNSVVNVNFNANNLLAGTYTNLLAIVTNDPSNDTIFVPCTLNVTGQPLIVLSANTINFGAVLVGAMKTDSVTISNNGCDSLIVSNIVSSAAQFSFTPSNMVVPPYANKKLYITFSPSAIATYNDSITVFNNALDKIIYVNGSGAPAPVISVSTDSLNATLLCGDSATTTLTIYNTGGINLTYQIAGAGSGSGIPLDSVRARINQRYAEITALVPNMYQFTDGITGNNISDGGNDMYDGGNYLNTDLGTNLNYSDNIIINSAAMGTGGKYFTRKNTGLFAFAADINAINYFEITGNLGADGSGNADTVSFTATKNGTTYRCFVKRVYNAGDPSINQLIIVKNDIGLSSTYSANTGDGQHRVSGLSNQTRLYYLLYASASGGFVNNTATNNIFLKFLDIIDPIAQLPDWISVNPAADTVATSDSSVVTVSLSANGLLAGTYTQNIYIISNDPANDTIIIPCTLTVVGQPLITISSNTINFGAILVGAMKTDSVTISNNGCDSLIVSNIISSAPEFTFTPANMAIAPFASKMLYITFSPTAIATYNDSITVFNNSSDKIIYLNGSGAPAPVISVSPDSLNATLLCGDSLTTTLTIYNTGGIDLNYQLIAGGGGSSGTVTYSEAFVSGQTPTTQATAWVSFRNQLTSKPYTKLKVSGSVNPTGVTLNNPTLVANIANAMNTMTAYTVTDGGNTWTVDINGCNNGVILTVNAPVCQCDAANPTLYVLRPEIGNANWGGINTATCTAPSQTMIVEFTYGTPFIQFSPSADTVASGDSSVVTVTFNAAGLSSGTYTGYILVTSNDPVNDTIFVPCTLTVNGQADIVLSSNTINFGSLMMNDSKTDSITVTNNGCDTLFISGISSSSADFNANMGNFVIPPFSSQTLYVTFTPSSVMTYTDSLTIFSNDTDAVVYLNGTGTPSPVIMVIPNPVNDTIYGCNGSTSSVLSIINSGLGNLNWNIYSSPSFYDDFDPAADASLWLDTTGGSSNTLCGSVSGNALMFNGNSTRNAVTKDLNTLSTSAISFYIKISNISGSCEDADAGEDVILQYSTNGGGSWTTITTFNVDLYPNFTLINQTLPAGAKTASTRFKWYQPSHSGSCCDHWALDNVTIGGTGFITASPTSGTTVPADTSVVNLTFDANGLMDGQYISFITVVSNDPGNDTILVPCTLTVIGTPVMVLSDTCVFFGNVLQGDTVSAFVTITNTGCADLNIGNIVAPANFDASPASFTLSPDSSYSVEVLFSPTAITTYSGNLTIFSNAGNQNICVSGTGVAAPDIAVSPASISVTLASCGDSSIWPLVITNSGAGTLTYNISGSMPSWVSVNPASDVVASGSSSSVMVTFNSTGLNGGQYTGNIVINSNDPDESPIIIPCTLNVSFNPCANFNVSNTSACTGSVTFADNTTNSPTSWSWSFGDGGTSSVQNPTHVYGVSGTFPVQLIACNGFGCDTVVQNVTVLNTGGPSAACSVSTTGYCCGMGIYNVTFNTINNTSSDGSVGYQDFTCTYSTNVTLGQTYSISVQTGTQYNENVKVWIDFNKNASFDVAELVFDSPNIMTNHTGSIAIPMSAVTNQPLRMRVMSDYYINTLSACTSVTYGQAEDYTVIVMPQATPPIADFNYFMPSACGATVIFADSSSNNPTSWSWNFGNGDSSNIQNPTYTYPAVGNYTVQLTVCNAYGCDTYTQAISISNIGTVTAACIPTTTSNCCGIGVYNVTFNTLNNSSGDGSEGYQDYTCFTGTSVTAGQSYTLSITTGTSVNENVRAWIDYNNNGVFESGEQIFSSNNQLMNHSGMVIISTSAVMNIPLRMRVGSDYFSSPAPSPCTNAIQGQFEDYAVTVLPANAPPIANFTSAITDTCLGVVQFTDLSSNAPNSWIWTFGDGGASSQQNPSHTYTASGTYTVTLIASNGFGSDTITSSITVTSLSASFTTSGAYEPGVIITFNGISSGASSWIWQFGDGNIASVQNPVHSYADTGIYTVILTVTAPNGCSAQYSQTIGIYPTGISVAGNENWGFEVYPNPNNGKFVVQITDINRFTDGKIKVYNILGEVVFTSPLSPLSSWRGVGGEVIDLSKQGSGIYYIQLSSEKGVLAKKVVVE